MPTLNLMVTTESGQLKNLQADDTMLVEDFKAVLEAEFGVPIKEQQVMLIAAELQDGKTLKQQQVMDGAVLVLKKKIVQAAAPADLGAQLGALFAQAQVPAAPQPAADIGNILQALRAPQVDEQDPEYQRKLQERIEQENIAANYESAIENNPESFARVIMLYINCEVNNVPMKAFVDSGAQSTIMSRGCAERCNLLRLLDKRFAGEARGVGSAKILGRIHLAMMKIGGEFFSISIQVLDQEDMDFLLGLDMLRKHQMSIDLKANVLRIGDGVETPFLQEHELPAAYKGGDRAAEAASSNMTDQEKLEKLLLMGFEEKDCTQALKECQGDEMAAAAWLTENRVATPSPK
eukprot:TRINITY_DN17015_c0_g1_i1.p1 TRINITY_DN17015_c0_g1~~TRINITY_DN17015_c0_g1_i1.p1  ORF type:complete len:349 (+),score=61.11 TRINITY_DN17015_c0_g1_i1:121-1167(+)